MSVWNKFKEAMAAEAKPWHLAIPEKYADKETANKRYEICLQCPELTEKTKICKQCGCFMGAKTKIELARCPLKKW